MLNKDFDVLKNWMFGSLSSLLDEIPPNPNLNILKMSIGEPQLGPPKFIRKQFDNFFLRLLCTLKLLLMSRAMFTMELNLIFIIIIIIIINTS